MVKIQFRHFINKKVKAFRLGFTLVEIIITVAIIALLASIAIPGIINARIAANEAAAKGTLRIIANAFEMYIIVNNEYPATEEDLIAPNTSPPYLNRSYDGQIVRGYQYDYQLNNGYTVVATPEDCGRTGNKTFTLTQNTINQVDCVPE